MGIALKLQTSFHFHITQQCPTCTRNLIEQGQNFKVLFNKFVFSFTYNTKYPNQVMHGVFIMQ
jgi:hypothetical protein